MSTSAPTERPSARPLIDGSALQAGVRRLGRQLSSTYDDGVVLVPVLKGSLLFVADLVRSMSVTPAVDFLAITSYAQGTGRVRLVKDLDADIAGRDVVLVEDIVDTGLTLRYLLGVLRARDPASIEVCTLLDKAIRRIVPVTPRYVGFECPDRFVVGYGLDFRERYRNLPDILQVHDIEALEADPNALVSRFEPA